MFVHLRRVTEKYIQTAGLMSDLNIAERNYVAQRQVLASVTYLVRTDGSNSVALTSLERSRAGKT